MKKSFLRTAAMISAAALMVSALSACGQGEKTSSTASGGAENSGNIPELASTWPEFAKHHEAKITWFEQGWTGLDEELDFVTPEIEKRTNFLMGYEAMTVPTGDDYTQKLNLMVAADEIPDIFFGGQDAYTREIYQRLGDNGKIWDLTEIIKDYENLYTLLYPELNLYKTADNKNYFIPTQTGRGNEVLNEPPHGLFVRKDFLDQLKMDYPRTPEAFKEYLRRCKEEITVNGQPVIGMVLGENLDGLNHLYEAFYPHIGSHESYTLPFDYTNDFKVVNYDYTNSPELLAAAQYVNSLVREGLMDREILTAKKAQIQEKITSGLTAAATMTWWDMNAFSDTAKETNPDLMYVNPGIFYASDEIKELRNREWTNEIFSWSSVIVRKTIDEETLRHFLAALDYLTTTEGQILAQAGIEGVSFKWNEEGKYEWLPEFVEKTNNLDWNKNAAYGVGYYAQMVFNIPAISDKQTVSPALQREDNHLSWENRQEVRDQYKPDMNPPKDYYFLPGEIEAQKFAAIKDARQEFWAKVVAAKSESEVESLVEEWGKTTKNMGIDEIVAERQAYMDHFVMAE